MSCRHRPTTSRRTFWNDGRRRGRGGRGRLGVEFDLEANPGSVQRGTEVIRRFWPTLPNAPGVYRMLDGKGDVLYVGKAKQPEEPGRLLRARRRPIRTASRA